MSLTLRPTLLSAGLLFHLVLIATAVGAPWSGWRGAEGMGVSSDTELPLTWSSTENVKWKVALPERGNSTPVVWGDRVFVTQAVGDERLILCFSRTDGKELWRAGARNVEKEPTHDTNPYCSASPVTDGERVYAWFGSAGLFCFTVDGKEVWKRDLGEHRHEWGYSASPVLHKDLCYLNFGPGERTFLLAVDKRTGRDAWRKDLEKVEVTLPRNDGFGSRGGVIGSWCVPVIINTGYREELVMSWPQRVCSYVPETGELLWQCGGLNPLVYSTTLFAEGLVVAMGGYGGSTVAVRPGGSGDVTETHRLWHTPRDSGHLGSGVVKDGHLYIMNMNGIAECVELKSGKSVWKERPEATTSRSVSWSSIVLVGDRIYVLNQGGDTFVLRAAPEFEMLATNALNDGLTNASLAVSDGQIFIRTHAHLWCIGE